MSRTDLQVCSLMGAEQATVCPRRRFAGLVQGRWLRHLPCPVSVQVPNVSGRVAWTTAGGPGTASPAGMSALSIVQEPGRQQVKLRWAQAEPAALQAELRVALVEEL